MPILALLAPVAAIILSLLLALAVCHAVLYGGVWACLVGPKSRPQQSDSNPEATGRVQTLSMLGMHIEDLKGQTYVGCFCPQHTGMNKQQQTPAASSSGGSAKPPADRVTHSDAADPVAAAPQSPPTCFACPFSTSPAICTPPLVCPLSAQRAPLSFHLQEHPC